MVKFKVITDFRGRGVGAYSRGRLFDKSVSRVGAYSRRGAYSRGTLNRSITVVAFFATPILVVVSMYSYKM